MFKYHYYKKDYVLPDKIITLIQKLLYDYTGFINVEIINNYIIEIHLRLNGDLFLYSEKNIDDMINGKLITEIILVFFQYLLINI